MNHSLARILMAATAVAVPLAVGAPVAASAATSPAPSLQRDGYINVMDDVSLSTNGETWCTVDPSSTQTHTRFHCGTITRNLIGNAVHVIVSDDDHPGTVAPTSVKVATPGSPYSIDVTREDFAFMEVTRQSLPTNSSYSFDDSGIPHSKTDGWAFGIDSGMVGQPTTATIDVCQYQDQSCNY